MDRFRIGGGGAVLLTPPRWPVVVEVVVPSGPNLGRLKRELQLLVLLLFWVDVVAVANSVPSGSSFHTTEGCFFFSPKLGGLSLIELNFLEMVEAAAVVVVVLPVEDMSMGDVRNEESFKLDSLTFFLDGFPSCQLCWCFCPSVLDYIVPLYFPPSRNVPVVLSFVVAVLKRDFGYGPVTHVRKRMRIHWNRHRHRRR